MAPQLFIGVSIGAGIEKIINLNQDPPTLLSILRRTMILLLALNCGWLTVMIYSRNKWLR